MLCIYIYISSNARIASWSNRTNNRTTQPSKIKQESDTYGPRMMYSMYIYICIYTCWFMCTSIKFTQWFTSYTAELLKNICGFVHRSLFRPPGTWWMCWTSAAVVVTSMSWAPWSSGIPRAARRPPVWARPMWASSVSRTIHTFHGYEEWWKMPRANLKKVVENREFHDCSMQKLVEHA